MKSLSVTIPLLIVFSFGWISALNILHPESNVDRWLNKDLEDLFENCILKKKEANIFRLIRDYKNILLKFINPIEEQGIEESNFVMHYIYNSDMINKLKELIKALQNCEDDKDRLDSEGVVEVMHQVLKEYAIKIANVEPISEKEIGCESSQAKSDICIHPEKDILEPSKVAELLKLSIIKINSTCEANLPYVQCYIKASKNCSPRKRKLAKVLLSPPEVSVCENYPQEEDPEIEEIGEEISYLFKQEEEKPFFFRKPLRF